MSMCKVTIINTVHLFSTKHIKGMDFFLIERIDTWLTNDVIDFFLLSFMSSLKNLHWWLRNIKTKHILFHNSIFL